MIKSNIISEYDAKNLAFDDAAACAKEIADCLNAEALNLVKTNHELMRYKFARRDTAMKICREILRLKHKHMYGNEVNLIILDDIEENK